MPVQEFVTAVLPEKPDTQAADGSSVRLLPSLRGGGLVHLELGPHQTSKAVTHRTVEEIWYFLSGYGQMWRLQNNRSEIIDLKPNMSVTIPVGTHFQFRSTSIAALTAIGVTIPPWPGRDEATLVTGPWLNTMP
jgi:mannose-6-phosphate isomerase-like protein (cupin superfamily)